MLTEDESAWIRSRRVAHLATIGTAGDPHVIPICFAFDGAQFYSALDEKPKRVPARELQRVRNIIGDPRVALLLDRYDDDWSQLAYVLVHGRAELIEPPGRRHRAALTLLRERYPQYATMALEERPVIAVTPERVASWGNLTSF
jgi:PPOX class probable F420-dependent enzyme